MKRIILFSGLLISSLTAKSQYLIGFNKSEILTNEAKYNFQELTKKVNDTGSVIIGTMENGAKIYYMLSKKSIAVSSFIVYGSNALLASKEMKLLDNNALKVDEKSWIVVLPDNSKIFVQLGYNQSLGYNFTHIKVKK